MVTGCLSPISLGTCLLNKLSPRKIAMASPCWNTTIAVAALAILATTTKTSQAQVVAYSNNFDTTPTVAAGVTGAFSGIVTTGNVQGYAGIGPAGNQFSGNMIVNGSTGNPASPTTLTLSGLPAHTSINLQFLFAAIDSWDGSNPSFGPDSFIVTVNGGTVFQQTISNLPTQEPQSYVPPAGVLLTAAPYADLGFDTAGDSAYNMGLDPTFQNIAQTASTLTISWFAGGPNYRQASTDEQWGIDNVLVLLNGTSAAAEPSTILIIVFGSAPFLNLAIQRRRKL